MSVPITSQEERTVKKYAEKNMMLPVIRLFHVTATSPCSLRPRNTPRVYSRHGAGAYSKIPRSSNSDEYCVDHVLTRVITLAPPMK